MIDLEEDKNQSNTKHIIFHLFHYHFLFLAEKKKSLFFFLILGDSFPKKLVENIT